MIPVCRDHCYHSLGIVKERCLARCCWCGANRVLEAVPDEEERHGAFVPA